MSQLIVYCGRQVSGQRVSSFVIHLESQPANRQLLPSRVTRTSRRLVLSSDRVKNEKNYACSVGYLKLISLSKDFDMTSTLSLSQSPLQSHHSSEYRFYYMKNWHFICKGVNTSVLNISFTASSTCERLEISTVNTCGFPMKTSA